MRIPWYCDDCDWWFEHLLINIWTGYSAADLLQGKRYVNNNIEYQMKKQWTKENRMLNKFIPLSSQFALTLKHTKRVDHSNKTLTKIRVTFKLDENKNKNKKNHKLLNKTWMSLKLTCIHKYELRCTTFWSANNCLIINKFYPYTYRWNQIKLRIQIQCDTIWHEFWM